MRRLSYSQRTFIIGATIVLGAYWSLFSFGWEYQSVTVPLDCGMSLTYVRGRPALISREFANHEIYLSDIHGEMSSRYEIPGGLYAREAVVSTLRSGVIRVAFEVEFVIYNRHPGRWESYCLDAYGRVWPPDLSAWHNTEAQAVWIIQLHRERLNLIR